MQRILVIGTSGSGKSTLARAIAGRLDLLYTPTDPFYWKAGWRPASSERVGACLEAVLADDAWILDGNFDDRRDQVWGRADCIIWLDLPWSLTVWRVAIRNVRWVLSREPVWSGNVMTWRRAWSGIRHAAMSHSMKRRLYPHWLAEAAVPRVWHFKTDREVAAWLKQLAPIADAPHLPA